MLRVSLSLLSVTQLSQKLSDFYHIGTYVAVAPRSTPITLVHATPSHLTYLFQRAQSRIFLLFLRRVVDDLTELLHLGLVLFEPVHLRSNVFSAANIGGADPGTRGR